RNPNRRSRADGGRRRGKREARASRFRLAAAALRSSESVLVACAPLTRRRSAADLSPPERGEVFVCLLVKLNDSRRDREVPFHTSPRSGGYRSPQAAPRGAVAGEGAGGESHSRASPTIARSPLRASPRTARAHANAVA